MSIASASALLWAVGLGVWIGYRMGARAERKQHNASLEAFAYKTVDRAAKLTQTRRFVGSGVTLTDEGKWTFGKFGAFKVTLEQIEDA